MSDFDEYQKADFTPRIDFGSPEGDHTIEYEYELNPATKTAKLIRFRMGGGEWRQVNEPSVPELQVIGC